MDEDAELGIAEPLRRLIRAETLPVIAKRAFRYRFVDIGQEAFAFTVVFAVGRGPLRIDPLRRSVALWCTGVRGGLPGVCAVALNVALRAAMPTAIEESVGKPTSSSSPHHASVGGILNAFQVNGQLTCARGCAEAHLSRNVHIKL